MNLQTQVELAEGKTSYMKSELFQIHDVILVNFRSDATLKTVPKYIRQPYGCAGSDRRKEELPSISQVV